MRLAFLLGICLALIFVVESFKEEDFIEDEQDGEEFEKKARQTCKSDSDCGPGECCKSSWIFHSKCKPLRLEGESCSLRPWFCHWQCQKGLECRRAPENLIFKRFKCFAAAPPPTEELGSGDVGF